MKRESSGPVLSAVFVDYDNIYLSLKRKSDEAAKRFAKDALLWLREIESGQLITPTNGSFGDVKRRLVMNRCYGNPVPRRNSTDNSTDMNSFPFVRHHFLRAGFEIIDCPPLTAQLKNSSDIRMVMDVRDFLTHETYFDEFVIMSGDADFTPVLHRLRAHARRTVIFANDYTASPYTAICDGEIRESDLIRLLLDGKLSGEAPAAVATSVSSADLERLRAEIMSDVVANVRQSAQPVPLEVLAERATRALGHERTVALNWAGAGSFRDLLLQNLPDEIRLTEDPPYLAYVAAAKPLPAPTVASRPMIEPRAPEPQSVMAAPAPQMLQAQPQTQPHAPVPRQPAPVPARQPAAYDAEPMPQLQSRPQQSPAAASNSYPMGQPAQVRGPERQAPPAPQPAPVAQRPRTPLLETQPQPPAQTASLPPQQFLPQQVSAPQPAPVQAPRVEAPVAASAAPQAPKMQPVTPPRQAAPQAAAQAPQAAAAQGLQQSIARILDACQAPPMSPPEYRTLFEAMAQEITEQGLQGSQTIVNIQSRAQQKGIQLQRDDVRFAMDVVGESDPWFEQGANTSLFASRFRNFVVARCRSQGLSLSVDELDLIEAWFAGGPPPAAQPVSRAPRPAVSAHDNGQQARMAMPMASNSEAQAGSWWSTEAPRSAPGAVSQGSPTMHGASTGHEPPALSASSQDSDEFPRIVRTRVRS